MPTSKSTTKSTTPKAPRKPRAAAVKKHPVEKKEAEEVVISAADETPVTHHHVAHEPAKAGADKGRYIFATGRRKTAVANVRLFTGKGDSIVNKQPFEKYFSYESYQEEILSPFQKTGLGSDYHFTSHVNGGGPHSQAGALRHGIATALGKISEEVRRVLKKNGLLTRDDRKKERKKPGLKRARRSPQWAKR